MEAKFTTTAVYFQKHQNQSNQPEVIHAAKNLSKTVWDTNLLI